MKPYRHLWAITLIFYFSGCTVYAPAYLPGEPIPEQSRILKESGKTGYSPGLVPDDPTGERPTELSPHPDQLQVGMKVRLTMVNDETISGKVKELNDEGLAFGKPGNYGLELEYYLFKDIKKIEVPHSSRLTKIVTISVLTLAGLVIVAGISIANAMSNGGWN